MTSLVVIQNKRHGSTHTVTADEWAAMQKKGHGKRIFKVLSETKIEPQPQPRMKAVVVPPEVQEIEAKKVAPPVEEVTKERKKARKAKTGAVEAPQPSA